MLAEVLLLMAAMMLLTVGQWIGFDQTAPFFRDFDWHTKHEWIGRITAGIVQMSLIGFAILQGRTSQWGAALILAYLLHDTGHMFIYDTDVTSYLHHIITTTVVGLMTIAMTPAQADVSTLAAAVLESTSPLLHVSWLLKQAGYSDAPFFKYVAGAAAAFFGLMRIGVFPWIMATKMDTVTRMVFAPLLALSVYWFWKIVKMMLKVLETKEAPASSTEQCHEA
jgi:hypothetical protein